jgi:7,8-dihydropterin-6-yl-methyl-4-(beta-D-ribofuranosyl)aminobenzene 5'-phosphate synthase
LADELCLTVLIEDSVETDDESKRRLIAKHGLSILVEAKVNEAKVCVLMDTGPSAEALLSNVDVIGVNLRKIDAIMLSHGHYDHTDGLIGVLQSMGKRVPVLAHPKVFNPKFVVKPKLRFTGSAFTLSTVENAGGVPLLASNPVKVADGITTTGEIQRTTTYEKASGFLTVEDGRFKEDSIIGDQALVVNLKNKGLVVITGCAHAGVVNTVRHARKIMKTERVYAVLGGFHLIDADDERIQATVMDLAKFSPEFLGPCHCTGEKATRKLEEAFGDKCRPLKTGDVLRF